MELSVDQPSIHVCGLLAYDGTGYHGFQYQVGVPTIQGTLETALGAFAQGGSRVLGSGRTDSGVHASGQVISVQVRWRHTVEDLQRAWNAHLPGDITLRNLQAAPAEFHPRFSAVSRTYRYTVYCYAGSKQSVAPRRSPLTDRFALYETRTLNLTAMQQAAAYLVGEHDFATFGQPPQGESTIRRLYQAEWQAVETNVPALNAYPGQCLVFTVTANAFLRQMVRNLVGALLEVGLGNWTPEDVQLALAARKRSCCAPPAPAHGLVLEKVEYPKHLGLFLN
ncbi:MAG: tRNA pseudouridine(38-40) synthase TruA [Caldilineaceae bacterium]